MSQFLITYDLNRPTQNYAQLLPYLRKLGAMQVLKSAYVVNSQLSSCDLLNAVRQNGGLDANDSIIVTPISAASCVSNNIHPKFKTW